MGFNLFVFSNNLINYAVFYNCIYVLQIHQYQACVYPIECNQNSKFFSILEKQPLHYQLKQPRYSIAYREFS